MPSRANIPTWVTYPGQITENETGVSPNSIRIACVHSMSPAFVAL